MCNRKMKGIISGVIFLGILSALIYWFIIRDSSPVSWELNKQYTYSIDYRSDTFNHFVNPKGQDQKLSGNFDCTMVFSIYPVKKLEDSKTIAQVSFDKLENCSFIYNGTNLFSDPMTEEKIFLNRRAALFLTPEGGISDIRFMKKEDQVFISTVKLITSYLRTNAEPDKKAGIEKDQNGSYKPTFKITKKDETTVISKKFDKYDSLLAFPSGIDNSTQDTKADFTHKIKERRIRYGSGEQKTTLYNQENTLTFSFNMTFDLNLLKVSETNNTTKLIGLSNMKTSHIGTVGISEKMKRKLQEKQTRSLSNTEIKNTLSEYGLTGKIDDKKLFVWRTSAYLKLYPERAADLIPIFQQKGFSSEAKILVMGVLTSAGHPKAQEVIRSLLETDSAKSDKLYPLLLQNISMLDTPDKKTMSFVEDLYSNAKENHKLETTTSLMVGSVAGKLMKQGDTINGLRLNKILLKDLDKAQTPAKAERMLDALGNAGIESNINAALPYSKSVNPRVRASATNVVRNAQTPESEKMLLDMLEDNENIVKMQAVNTLGNYSLKEEHLEHIKNKLHDDTLGPDQYYYVLGVLKQYEKVHPEVVKKSLVEMTRRSMHADLHSQVSGMLKNMRKKK